MLRCWMLLGPIQLPIKSRWVNFLRFSCVNEQDWWMMMDGHLHCWGPSKHLHSWPERKLQLPTPRYHRTIQTLDPGMDCIVEAHDGIDLWGTKCGAHYFRSLDILRGGTIVAGNGMCRFWIPEFVEGNNYRNLHIFKYGYIWGSKSTASGSPLTEIHGLNQFYVVELLCSVPLWVAGAADHGEKEGALPHHVGCSLAAAEGNECGIPQL